MRVQSLSKALHRSRRRLILIEGEPGSGKSVAVRHVARKLVLQAERHRRDPNVLVPIYVNLKELDVGADQISHEVIEKFVLTSINRANKVDIEEFLDQEFKRGLVQGSWFFLFDSFDEIPAILSAVEPDAIVQRFTDAITDFLSGSNLCRAVIASRSFRGPETLSWPRFRILRLTDKRQRQLIKKFYMSAPDRDLLKVCIH